LFWDARIGDIEYIQRHERGPVPPCTERQARTPAGPHRAEKRQCAFEELLSLPLAKRLHKKPSECNKRFFVRHGVAFMDNGNRSRSAHSGGDHEWKRSLGRDRAHESDNENESCHGDRMSRTAATRIASKSRTFPRKNIRRSSLIPSCDVVIAAITSFTNTSNPSVMLAA